ncbi:sigma factor-like helix-turn-helix DNA-binding protein [Aerococcus viridans]|uniref:sigma factor-like helix-turn-helix DNA-binding protein n=1 Tax=Aerococcus viridans TaxID=1377 RepID=UPI0038130F85
MNNYIRIPSYIEDVKTIHSNNLSKLDFSKYSTEDKNIYSLNLLRDLYKTQRDLFFTIRDEMLLRGFEIHTETNSSLFPNTLNSQNSELICKAINNDSFLHLDFESLKLGNFINQFDVNDDQFFDLIPIENFKILNQGIDIEVLHKEFYMNDFGFLKNADNAKAFLGLQSNKDNNIGQNYAKVNVVIEPQITRSIDYIFSESKFNKFRDFCYKNHIKYLDDLEKEQVEEFKKVRGIGAKKVKEVTEKIKELKNKGDFPVLLDPSENYKISDEIKSMDEFIFTLDSALHKKYYINTIFKDNKFNIFREFCEGRNLFYIENITYLDINLFKNFPNVGKTKFNSLCEKIEELKINLDIQEDFVLSYDTNHFDFHEYAIKEVLNIVNPGKKVEKNFNIGEIFGKDIRDLNLSDEDREIYLELTHMLHQIDNPNNIIKKFIDGLKDRDYAILTNRYRDKHTLEIIGQNINITRERVRQILAKISRNFVHYLELNFFKESLYLSFLSFDFTNKVGLTISDFRDFIDQEYIFVLEILAEQTKILFFSEKYNRIFLNEEENNNFEEELAEIYEELPDLFLLEEIQEVLESDYFKNGTLTIQSFLEFNSFKFYGKLYSRKNLSIAEILKYIFERDLSQKVKMSTENFEKIKHLAEEKYEYVIKNPVVSVSNALSASDDFILVDSSTFQLFNIEEYNFNVLEKCMNFGKQLLDKRNTINIVEIYNRYQGELELENITNKLHLYSLLKYMYSNEFDFGKGNTLNIYKTNSKKLDQKDMLINFLQNNQGIASKDDIKSNFGWSDQKINLVIASVINIVSWGQNKYRLIGEWLSNEYLEETKLIITKHFEEFGFITENQLFEEAQFSSTLYKLIDEEKANTSEKFRSIFRPFLQELRGNQVFITPEGSKYQSIYDHILEKFPEGVARDELQTYLSDELLYRSGTMGTVIDKLLIQNIMFEGGLGYLYPNHKLQISRDIEEEVLNYIEEEKKGKPYIILKNLIGYRSKLPSINMEWNPYIIKHILVENGYKNVEVFNRDYRMDQLILIEEDHEINTLDELLFFVLKNNYEGNWHEEYVAKYLEKTGFLREKSYERKRLPVSIYKNSSLISVDELGIVNLMEG